VVPAKNPEAYLQPTGSNSPAYLKQFLVDRTAAAQYVDSALNVKCKATQ